MSDVGHAPSPTLRAPGRRAAHLGPERRRPMVLDAAFELFLEHGYEGTSMEAIARATGVTKPVVYACYPSKEELFKALLVPRGGAGPRRDRRRAARRGRGRPRGRC